MNSDERKLYADAVWDAWTLRIGCPTRHMSANEWTIVKEWLDRELPLRFVLQAMETVKGKPKSLRYLVPIVDEEAVRARRALVF